MKILTLTAENFMRLAAVEITPDGNMVQITGRNGMGKSSVLNAIWAAIERAKKEWQKLNDRRAGIVNRAVQRRRIAEGLRT